MAEPAPKYTYLIGGLLIILALALGGLVYYWNTARTLEAKLTANTLQFTTDLAAKTSELAVASERVNSLETTLKKVEDDLEELEDDYRDEKNKNDDFEDQIKQITGTVRDLDKLSKIDEELLQKYSKVYFLNENYAPAKIKEIDEDYILPGKDAQFFHASAITFLEDMIEDAQDDDIDLKVISAYRSFDHQEALKGQFTTIYGEGANAFSADQGYSEHQLGTAVDLTDPSTGGTYQSFANAEAYKWLQKNAYKYGFTLSYPEGNAFYIFEPWHWRFVGTDLAKKLHRDDDLTFYTMEQRDIDEYLLNIFD